MTGPGLRRFIRPQSPSPQAASPRAPAGPGAPAPARGTRGQPAAGDDPAEACEMCGTPVQAGHGHVVDLERSSLLCTCRACYLLFTHSGAGLTRAGGGRARYRAVPDRYLSDPRRPMSVAEWDELEIPVGLAFFLRRSGDGRVSGFYPSPAGVTESRLDLGSWERMAAAHPLLRAAEADVEAVLVHRAGRGEVEHFVIPVDACYELAGRLRLLWRGFDGGSQARDAIAGFLGQVRSRARELAPEPEG